MVERDFDYHGLIGRQIGDNFSPTVIEDKIGRLGSMFPGADFKSLREYHAAVEALKSLGEAAATRYLEVVNAGVGD